MKNLSLLIYLPIFFFSCSHEVSEEFKSSIFKSETDLNRISVSAKDLFDNLKTESTKWNTSLADMKFELEDNSAKSDLVNQADSLIQVCKIKSSDFGSMSGQVAELIITLDGLKSSLEKLKLEVLENKVREDIANAKLQEINNQIIKSEESVNDMINQVSETKTVCESAVQAFNSLLPSK